MFWGVAEPLSHYIILPYAEGESQSLEATKTAMNIAPVILICTPGQFYLTGGSDRLFSFRRKTGSRKQSSREY